jgi:myosin heavy subunit
MKKKAALNDQNQTEAMERSTLKIQKWWRKCVARKHLMTSRRAAVIIQAAVRGHQTRMAFKFKKEEQERIRHQADASAKQMLRKQVRYYMTVSQTLLKQVFFGYVC